METILKPLLPVLLVTALAGVTLAQSRFVVQVEDQSGKAVRGATVSVECGDGVIRNGVTDAKGEAAVAFSRANKCTFSVSGPDIVLQSDRAAMSDYPTGIVLPVIRRSAAAKASGCPPERTLRNGACGTAAQARAEAEIYCRSLVRGSTVVSDSSGGYRCGCAAGRVIYSEGGESRCETIRNIRLMAANECRNRDRDLIASPVDSEGQYECRCPDGKEWRDATRDSSGGCVSTTALNERATYCESQLSGSIWTKDRMGRLGCFCPSGSGPAGGKCIASAELGQNCPAGRVRRDGTCATEAEFEAEFSRSCSMSIRGGVAVPDEEGGLRCGCPSGRFLLSDAAGQRCESRQNLALEASNDCKRRNPDLVPTEIDIMGRYNCQCPAGKEWKEPTANERGGCVAKPASPNEKYREFWGTWRGTKVASGITFVLNADGTGTHTDTRPGYQKHIADGRWGPNATTGCIDAIVFRLCMHPDGTVTDPWGNVYTR